MEDFNGILLKFKTIKLMHCRWYLFYERTEPYRGKIIATKSKIIYDIGLVYCYDHNYCILIVCTLHITVVCHDGNNLAPRHFLPILNSFSPSGGASHCPARGPQANAPYPR